MILLEYQNIKTFLQKAMFLIGLKKFSRLKKLKRLCREFMLLVILKVKKLLGHFTKKNYKIKINKKEFRVEKVIKGEGDILYVKWNRVNKERK